MKGSNEFELNEQTMIQAVQEWIDKRWSDPKPKVTSVEGSGNGPGSYGARRFKIKLQGETDEGE